jgi:DNA-binding PadR family transcriptional regulator
MDLTSLERAFLERLAGGPWTSPALFDHSIVGRLVDAGLVQAETSPDGSVRYEITKAGQEEIGQD